jgi:hypothetical protein
MVGASYKWLLLVCWPAFIFMTRNCLPGPVPGSGILLHPFHVSVTEINHNAAEKTLELSCKIFTDDFEEALSKSFKTKVDLEQPKDKEAMDRLVTGYIHNHLQVKADTRPVTLNYLGFEVENEAVFVYLQATAIPSVNKLDVFDSILHDLFHDQSEIIHVSVGGNRKSSKIDYPVNRVSFGF